MTALARRTLRTNFLKANMGISGVNFAVAETGSICLVTNEGNGRLTTTLPPIHVALMGMERLVPTLADLGVMLQILSRSATGQKLGVYTNIITGPRRETDSAALSEPDGPAELHVVIIDNGRSKILGSELAEILYCIRCGACINACPVYRQIGGHAYGSVYPGPIGSVFTPGLLGIESWSELPHASSLCGAVGRCVPCGSTYRECCSNCGMRLPRPDRLPNGSGWGSGCIGWPRCDRHYFIWVGIWQVGPRTCWLNKAGSTNYLVPYLPGPIFEIFPRWPRNHSASAGEKNGRVNSSWKESSF